MPEIEDEDEEDDSEDAINEFDFLGSGEDGEGSPDPRRCAGEGAHHELGEWRVFWPPHRGQQRHTQLPAAASCPRVSTGWTYFLRGGGPRESRRAVPQQPGLHPFPGKSPWGHRQARFFLTWGCQPCAACVQFLRASGRKQDGTSGERQSGQCLFLWSWDSELGGPRGHGTWQESKVSARTVHGGSLLSLCPSPPTVSPSALWAGPPSSHGSGFWWGRRRLCVAGLTWW